MRNSSLLFLPCLLLFVLWFSHWHLIKRPVVIIIALIIITVNSFQCRTVYLSNRPILNHDNLCLSREHLSRVSKWATAQGPLIFQARHLHWHLLSSHPSSHLFFVGWTISPERVSSAGVDRRLKCQWFEGHYHTGICFIEELSSQVLSRHKQTPNNQTNQTNRNYAYQ